ncbi:hypothetical protein GCM10022222_84370 [Amycolatopsis ultiminotia]|uniref:DNA primase/polymerase bifunctional N-terminal domain-containing protein n=1 Tax=Amycolatopsis ultiminotia TaxID=543629 RepID=A0ABP6YMP5_9PSEU
MSAPTRHTASTSPGSSPFLDAALDAAARGWAVFPLRAGSKRPAIAGWERQATRNPEQIRTWWTGQPTANIGIACGPSNLLVLDFDAARGVVPERWARLGVTHGRDVIALLAARARQPVPHHTLKVTTPRGEHWFFRLPPGTRVRSTVGAGRHGLGWHADTRGPGSLVVAPGSVGHVDGITVPYTISQDLPVALAPGWLVTILTPPPPSIPSTGSPPPPPARSRRVTAYVHAALTAECRNVATADEGERHIRLFAAAAALGELLANGWISHADITRHLTAAARRHLGVADFGWHELTTTIRDGIETGQQHRRVMTDRPRPHQTRGKD